MMNAHDEYINMQVKISHGSDGMLEHAVVKQRALDVDGMPVAKAINNPVLDTRTYEVEYEDGTMSILSANIMAESILSEVDD